MSTEVENKRVTKIDQVKAYLRANGSITQLQAWQMFSYSRLGDGIFRLRKQGWNIITEDMHILDRNNNHCTFAKYILVNDDKTAAIKPSFEDELKFRETGDKIEKPHKYVSRETSAAQHAVNILKQVDLFQDSSI